MPRGCLQFVIVVFPDHTHLLFLIVDIDIECLAECRLSSTNFAKSPFGYFGSILNLDIESNVDCRARH